jgi:hypothetical protein
MTDPNPSSTPIFRTVEIGQDVPVTLGEPLSAEAMALMTQVGPQRFLLKPGTYAGAEEIDVQLGVGAAVQQMDFTYGPGANYQEMVADYEAELGPPTSQQGGGDQVTVWQDANTRFQLVNGASGIRSMLRNLAPTAQAPA